MPGGLNWVELVSPSRRFRAWRDREMGRSDQDTRCADGLKFGNGRRLLLRVKLALEAISKRGPLSPQQRKPEPSSDLDASCHNRKWRPRILGLHGSRRGAGWRDRATWS